MIYSFSVKEAKEKGLHQAIFLAVYSNLEILLPKDDIISIDGKTWFSGSVVKIQRKLPFISKRQITSMLKKMVKDGYLIKKHINTNHLNRTYWYCFV